MYKIKFLLASAILALCMLTSNSLFAHFGPRGLLGGSLHVGIEYNGIVYLGSKDAGVFISTNNQLVGWTPRPVGLTSGKITALAHSGIELEVNCSVRDEWPLDRDLMTDVLNNAVQNAGRHARKKVRLSAWNDESTLFFRVEDDGEGYADPEGGRSTGLIVAERIASLHERQKRMGSMHLANGGELGGAILELRLP